MVEMAILGTVVSVQRVMNGTDCGYFSIETYSGGGFKYPGRGTLYQILLVPVFM
jgi:hypothetical protein